MRVIAGSAKGRRLEMPPTAGVRPTSDRARETLFNVLGADVAEARVLDAFAGSGAVGIEALSRGARAVTFVERSRRVAAVLRDNVDACGFTLRASVLGADWHAALRRLGKDVAAFDLAFFDPPYDWKRSRSLSRSAGGIQPLGRRRQRDTRARQTHAARGAAGLALGPPE